MRKSHLLKNAFYGLVFLLGSQHAWAEQIAVDAFKNFGYPLQKQYTDLAEYSADLDAYWQPTFDNCMAAAQGEYYWNCQKYSMVGKAPGEYPLNIGFTNGEPNSYKIFLERYVDTKNYDGHSIYTETSETGSNVGWHCPSGFVFKSDGPVENRTVWCELAEEHPSKNLGYCPVNYESVNPATGNNTEKSTDTSSGSTGAPRFRRHYNSTNFLPATSLGSNWTHSYSSNAVHFQGIEGLASESLTFNRHDGRVIMFSKSNGAWVGDNDVTDQVKDHVDGTGTLDGWDYVTAANAVERYDLSGKLLSITSADGLETTLSYDANDRLENVTGAYGHDLTFGYDTENRITSVTEPDNRVYNYSYDTNNNLVAVEYPDNTTRQYLYEDANYPNALTGIINENGDRSATWSYDVQGRVIAGEKAAGQESFTVTYNPDGSSTVVDVNGNTRNYTFDQLYGVYKTSSIQGDICSGCGGQDAARTYDANGFLASRTDQNGNVTTYVNDARGLELSRTEAAGTPQARTITTEWHPDYRLSTKVTRPSIAAGKSAITETSYGDTAHPRLPTVITRNGFAPDGSAISAHTVSLQYTADGRVAQIDGPRSDVADITTMTYYPNDTLEGTNRGQLKTVSNALGQTVTYDNYDAYGNVLQMTDANGTVTIYTYDSRQRVLSQTVTPTQGAPRTTTYSYDGIGQLISTTTPVGVTLTYAYDAAKNLRSISDNLGNRIDYDYDAKGNRTQEVTTDPVGILVRLVDTTYDSRDRVDSINAAGSLTTMVYDAVGNLTSTTDPNYNTPTTQSYDALNRLMQSVDALSGTTSYDYDVNDRVISVTAPNTARTAYAYDDLGNMLSEQSPDRGARTYVYDAAGNQLSLTDARNISVAYSYDALGRVTTIDYPGTAEDASFTYDVGQGCTFGIGRLCRMLDESGTTDYAYDAFGNVISQTKTELGITYTTAYAYDAGDNVIQTTYPGGRVVATNRDLIGRIAAITVTVNGVDSPIVSEISYRADNLVTGKTYGNGIDESRSYDLQGRLLEQGSDVTVPGVPADVTVTLTPSVASPSPSGSAISITAQASDSSVYEYQFSLQGPATNNIAQVVRPFSLANTWLWNTTSADNGDSTISVEIRLAASPAGATQSGATLYTIGVGPVESVVLTSANASPTVAGTATLLTASAVGGSGNAEYRFTLNGPSTGNAPVVVQAYSSSATWDWVSSVTDTGTYTITVDARNVGSSETTEATLSLTHALDAQIAATAITVDAAPATPAIAGNAITLTATASGGNVGEYEYKFRHRGPDTGNAWVDSPYSLSNTYTLPTSEENSVGTHYFYVYARNVGSTASSEVYKYISNYSVKTSIDPPTAVAVEFTPASPGVAESPVILTATASGGNVGEYEYRFRHRGPDTGYAWVDTPYSLSNTYTLPTTEESSVGTHYFYVYARSVGSATPTEVYKYISNYSVKTSIDPPTAVAVEFTPASPGVAESPVILTATASGGNVGEYEYRFRHRGPDTGYAWVDTPYSLSNTYTLPTSEESSVGTHYFYVYARSVGSATPTEVYKYISNYTVKTSIDPPTAVAVEFTPASPIIAGNTITLTATASGGNVGEYEYRFRHRGPDTGYAWVDTPYSLSNTYTLPTSEESSVGAHYFYVYARSVGSATPTEVYKYISNYYVNSSVAKLDSNFRYVSQTLPVTSDGQDMNQVAIANKASGDGYDYWVKADSGQWQKLDSAAQLGKLTPDSLVYMSQDYLDVWYRSEVQEAAYRFRRISAPPEARAVAQANAPGKFIKVAAGSGLETRSYNYDANGNVTDILSPAGIQDYGYDALNRIIGDAQPTQDPISLGYDGNGNRTSRTQGESVTPYSYLPNSNILSDVDSAGYTHDAVGNRTSDQGGNRTFEYNNAGRLFKVYEGGSQIAAYTYNALGQRTRKTTSNGTTIYHYDREGNLISETESDGRPIRDYVWQGAEPVAQIDVDGATETVTYLHTDHLATPRSATDDTGTVVWRWESDAFGGALPTGSVAVNLRFPGQYYDQETGLHYNYFRYYDPQTGRYVTSDPIGLDGGPNTYLYAKANPLRYIDIDGLRVRHIIQPNFKIWTCEVTCPVWGDCGCPKTFSGSGFGKTKDEAISAAYIDVYTTPLPSGCRVPNPAIELPGGCKIECRRNHAG